MPDPRQRVAYWKEDATGVIHLYNQNDEYLTTVPKAQVPAYIAAYSSNNDAALYPTGGGASVGKTTSGGSGGMTASQAATAARQAEAFNEEQRQFDLTQGERKARGDQEMRLAQDKFAFDKTKSDREFDLAQRQYLASLRGPDDYIRYWRESRGQGGTPQTSAGAAPAWASQSAAAAPAMAAPKWTQAAPGWQQGANITSPTPQDIAANSRTTANTFQGMNGVPIDFSGSEWMKKQVGQIPAWAR